MISITRDPQQRGGYLLLAECHLERPIDEVFDFFADAMNLERITPPLLKFHVVTPPPIEMRQGALIDYRLKLRGFPMRWRTEIAEWDPPHRFVDNQLRGPYRQWRHLHTFEPTDTGTLVKDRVQYRVPGGPLVHQLIVKRDVLAIFEYRQRVLAEIFPAKSAQSLQHA
jgi:ligand-binding SRPBCC domain-containing protein